MMAREAGLPFRAWTCSVYASDISHRMLRKARQGVYREASFRETRGSRAAEATSARRRACGASPIQVKKHVDFIHLNLLDRSKVALLGAMDVILCRNVIIYFDPESKRARHPDLLRQAPAGRAPAARPLGVAHQPARTPSSCVI